MGTLALGVRFIVLNDHFDSISADTGERADHRKGHMGLAIWKNAPDGKVVKADVSIAKNYLTQMELKDLDRFVTMYLDYAERQARRQIPMTMEDWAKRLDVARSLQ